MGVVYLLGVARHIICVWYSNRGELVAYVVCSFCILYF